MSYRPAGKRVRIFQPINRLTILADRPGGMLRTMAIERAARRLADQRLPVMKAIVILVATLEDMAGSGQPLLAGEMPAIRRVTGQLLTLALIYELRLLSEVAMKLCDLMAAFIRDGRGTRDAVAVHVRALRLCEPGAPPLPDGRAQSMLAELDRLLAHFGAAPPDAVEF